MLTHGLGALVQQGAKQGYMHLLKMVGITT